MPDSRFLDVSPFQTAFGRLCDLTARALADGIDRYEVQRAFEGRRPDTAPVSEVARADLARIRAHRTYADQRRDLVRHHAATYEVSNHDLIRALVTAGREARAYAEAEWMVTLPIVDPHP